jgi:hypothetical protein
MEDRRQVDDEMADARAIVSAIRRLRANPAQRVEARTNAPAVLDRLGLVGTARYAVAATLGVTLSGEVAALPGTPWFWSI